MLAVGYDFSDQASKWLCVIFYHLKHFAARFANAGYTVLLCVIFAS
jgi:hypothetical protein